MPLKRLNELEDVSVLVLSKDPVLSIRCFTEFCIPSVRSRETSVFDQCCGATGASNAALSSACRAKSIAPARTRAASCGLWKPLPFSEKTKSQRSCPRQMRALASAGYIINYKGMDCNLSEFKFNVALG